ncbi:PilT/PilU family type 4a pilus ATPase [Planctomycetota bacterium]
MKQVAMQPSLREKLMTALRQSQLFNQLEESALEKLPDLAELLQVEDGEALTVQGTPSDSFALILRGEAAISVGKSPDETVELGSIMSPATFGEVGLLLGQPRTANVTATGPMLICSFSEGVFHRMFRDIPKFGFIIAKGLAKRLQEVSWKVPLPGVDLKGERPSEEVLALLPVAFMERHHVIPLKVAGNVLTTGVVGDPARQTTVAIRNTVPGMEVKLVRIDTQTFNEIMRSIGGGDTQQPDSVRQSQAAGEDGLQRSAPKLDPLLKRVVAEGASDLHLLAGHKPRWRIDGDLQEIISANVLARDEVLGLLEPVLEPGRLKELETRHDVDLVYAVPGLARFRINLFRDRRGVSAALRQISPTVMTIDQLGLPQVLKRFCEHQTGLVLVTGGTGAGKSTTLAAMIDQINRRRRDHVICIEDPVEFVHTSRRALITQRQIGEHAESYARALRAAVREDPDIVLIGEMRDRETVALALETAATGHLVLGTMHTSSAVGTVDRVVDLFPADQHNHIRGMLANCIRGVVSQTLIRRLRGGRVAACEVMVGSVAVSNLIREAKTAQIPTVMQTHKADGNLLLDDALAQLVTEKKVRFEDALMKSRDREQLAKHLGRPHTRG